MGYKKLAWNPGIRRRDERGEKSSLGPSGEVGDEHQTEQSPDNGDDTFNDLLGSARSYTPAVL
jgi:hypothetical protein